MSAKFSSPGQIADDRKYGDKRKKLLIKNKKTVLTLYTFFKHIKKRNTINIQRFKKNNLPKSSPKNNKYFKKIMNIGEWTALVSR